MDDAIKEMFPGDQVKQEAFLKAMLEGANLVNVRRPQDNGRVFGGVRQENIDKLNASCSDLITITCAVVESTPEEEDASNAGVHLLDVRTGQSRAEYALPSSPRVTAFSDLSSQ